VGCLCLLGATGACDLWADAPQIALDPALLDAGAEDLGVDLEDAGDVGQGGAALPFDCQPPCLPGQFCGPRDLCYPQSRVCQQPGQVCDPTLTPNTPAFVCEAVFDGGTGVCRATCEPQEQETCPGGAVCTAYNWAQTRGVCRPACTQDGDCSALDACQGAPSGVCRGRCLPFVSNACGEKGRCMASSVEAGFCEPAGAGQVGDPCDDDSDDDALHCGDDRVCLDSAAGARCFALCAPGSSGDGACPAQHTCLGLEDSQLGSCVQRCELFNPERACAQERQGCSVSGTQQGICLYRGATANGGACQSTQMCSGDQQCVTLEGQSVCAFVCLPGVPTGLAGACPAGQRCTLQEEGDTLGVCRGE
jgi:hypothetical protein